ncbi:B3 domain-containing transcription factor VRN1 isoform X3 [Ricinus communis]|uniref:B3 domain-containing transcription factor VRN1 isoform X3 n=1 Tax=Ricinus communis TaxID=3988 RepID=UPI00201B2C73|nr:B3 domain-containing transcription factor VRN1 isoform X3 [Ricinus communis]
MGPEEGSNSPARTNCMFYKLIVASILHDKKLRIPEKFVKKYRDELSCIATLTVPNGRIWVVELEKVNKKLWFCSGWHEFVEYYSIRVGYFLVFRYEGESNFRVCIFDLTVSEIRYPGSGNPSHTTAPSRSMLFDKFVHSKWTVTGNYEASREMLLSRKDAYDSQDIDVQLNGSEFITQAGSPVLGEAEGRTRSGKLRTKIPNVDGQEQVDKRSPSMKIACEALTRRWRAVTPEEKQRTICAAHTFKPDNPFFRVILRPSYVYRGFLLHIPSSFAQRYLTTTGCMTLQVSEGKQWPVRCVCRNRGAKLSKGWTEFAWDNNLEEGDVCVFELINMNVLKVTIFRVLESAATVNQLPNTIVSELNK